jgi:hypothetical protein
MSTKGDEPSFECQMESNQFMGWYDGYHGRDAEVEALKAEIERLRSLFQRLRRAWFKGGDLDKDHVSREALAIFIEAETGPKTGT